MRARDRHRLKILKYLANPENDWPNRGGLAVVAGIAEDTFRGHFNADDIDEIESTGLELRRKRCAGSSAQVDKGLLKKATDGDPAACKLYYQRIEGWTEKSIKELTGKDGAPLTKFNVSFVDPPEDRDRSD